jgi:predicted amino acid-binding ACT domain protein
VIPDRPGAINEVTQKLARHDINLLSVYTKVLVYYEKMTLVVVADTSKCPLDSDELRALLEEFVASFGGRYELSSFNEIDF